MSEKIPDLTRVNGYAYLPDELVLKPSAPMISARRLLKDRFTGEKGQYLYHHRGSFYCWNGTHHVELTNQYLSSEIYHFLEYARRDRASKDGEWKSVPFHPKKTHVNEILSALASAAFLNDFLDAPSWLEETPDLLPHEIISCENGLLHLPSHDLMPHTPLFYTHNSLDYRYESQAATPSRWINFLNQLWPNDEYSINTLQEMFGYSLVSDTSQQKAFLLVGPKRSGKGTIARVLQAVIGHQNVVGPTLTGLSTNFGMEPLIGKRLAIISDARLSGRADAAIIAERLLSITGEDTTTIDRKHKSVWTGKLDIRFLILSNELPRIADASGALASRFIVMQLTRSFFGQEDQSLTSRLMLERPGILNWAIEGYERLRERGYFLQPESAREAIQELEDIGSPVGAFVRDKCLIDPNRSVSVDDLYQAWLAWCQSKGRDHPSTKDMFGRDLRAVFPSLRKSQPRGSDGGRIPTYEGISLTYY